MDRLTEADGLPTPPCSGERSYYLQNVEVVSDARACDSQPNDLRNASIFLSQSSNEPN